MKSAGNAIQTAVYGLLTSDTGSGGLFAPGAALVLGVFDAAGVPEAQAMPYITIGYYQSIPFTTLRREGEDITLEIHVWTRTRGFKNGNAILNRINQRIGNTNLNATGYDLSRSIFVNAMNVPDPESDIEHIISRYRVLAQEAP
jgi:hypothetical protein